jgi:hypothetical protein
MVLPREGVCERCAAIGYHGESEPSRRIARRDGGEGIPVGCGATSGEAANWDRVLVQSFCRVNGPSDLHEKEPWIIG